MEINNIRIVYFYFNSLLTQLIFDIVILNHGHTDIFFDKKIKEKLYQYNIKPIIPKYKIDEKILEKKLLTDLGDLMWVNVKKEGARLFIEYVKRETTEIENYKGQIFAASSGIIKRDNS